ncbi:addiction module antidote protein, HigA family [Paracidovorax avenae]|uniref:HigA family addiction module antitoxin n=1 Tax=Paracidovorax avenae TaxID=80867 RepID=UPI000D229F2B|nr:HigA family addiction module antitoxin [Paracidovorax avenae]AVS98716.1 addiction module antidote protein, HigA family [Paracidovorax avenae]
MTRLSTPTPGEILATEFLEPMGLTQYSLAQSIHVPQTRIATIFKEGRAITADTALRLARFFGTSVEFWMNLQSQYDADIGACQGSCRVDQAARGCVFDAVAAASVMPSRSGLSVTDWTGAQLRVLPDQRSMSR